MGDWLLELTMPPGCNTWSKGGQHGETRRQSSSCDRHWSGIRWYLPDTQRLFPRDTPHKPASWAPTHLNRGQFSVILQSWGARCATASTKANAHPTRTTGHFYMFPAIASTWCSTCATTQNSTVTEKHRIKTGRGPSTIRLPHSTRFHRCITCPPHLRSHTFDISNYGYGHRTPTSSMFTHSHSTHHGACLPALTDCSSIHMLPR